MNTQSTRILKFNLPALPKKADLVVRVSFGALIALLGALIMLLPKSDAFLSLVNQNTANSAFAVYVLNNLAVVARHLYLTSVILLLGKVLIKDSKTKFTPIFYLVNLVFYLAFIFKIRHFFQDQSAYFSLIVPLILLATFVAFYVLVRSFNTSFFHFSKKHIFYEVLLYLVVFLFSLSPLTLQVTFGHMTYRKFVFTRQHLFMLLAPFVLIFILTNVYINRTHEYKKFLLFTVSLAVIYSVYSVLNKSEIFTAKFAFSPFKWLLLALPFIFLFELKRAMSIFTMFSTGVPLLFVFFLQLKENGSFFSLENMLTYLPALYLIVLSALTYTLRFFEMPSVKDLIIALVFFTLFFVVTAVILRIVDGLYSDNKTVQEHVDFFYINRRNIVDHAKFKTFLGNLRSKYRAVTIKGKTVTFPLTYLFITWAICTITTLTVSQIFLQIQKSCISFRFVVHKLKKDRQIGVVKIGKITPELKKELDMKDSLVKVQNFSKKYANNDFYSVKDVSFEISGGKIVGFVGHNGAGKSTLIKSLVGIQTITEGTISICGYNIEKNPTEAKYSLGYVSDNHALYEELTGREYITFVAKLFNVPKEVIKTKLIELTDFFQITYAIDRQIRTYSHGMKQKISVISSLIHEPKVWVLDEPLTGLDPTSAYQLKEAIKMHAKKGNIVIFSSHIIEVVENICDEVVIIKRGQMVINEKVSELKAKYGNLEQMYIKLIEQ